MHKTNSFKTSVSTPSVMTTSPSKSSKNSNSSIPNNDINNIDLLSLINQCPSSVNIWDSVQFLVQKFNKELLSNQSSSNSIVSIPSISLLNGEDHSISKKTNNSNEKEESFDYFCQQQLNHINQLNALLMTYDHNEGNTNNSGDNSFNTNSKHEDLKIKLLENNKSVSALSSSSRINSSQLNQAIIPNFHEFHDNKYEFQHSNKSPINSPILKHNRSIKTLVNPKNHEDQENIYLSEASPKIQVPENNTVEDKEISSSFPLTKSKNTSVLESIDDNHYNYDIDFDKFENKLIIDIPIEINPVIEKIRNLRKNKEIQLMITKISGYCEEKLQRVNIEYFFFFLINLLKKNSIFLIIYINNYINLFINLFIL